MAFFGALSPSKIVFIYCRVGRSKMVGRKIIPLGGPLIGEGVEFLRGGGGLSGINLPLNPKKFITLGCNSIKIHYN